METQLWDIELQSTLLFDPRRADAMRLATRLRQREIPVEVATSAEDMLAVVRKEYFPTVLIVADIDDADCLIFLDRLRSAASRSWIIVASARIDDAALALVRRHGADVLVAEPVLLTDLISSLTALQLRTRSDF
jgi:DNA-binding response OmpR family regulator